MAKKAAAAGLDQQLNELENLVQRMEHGDLTLEASLAEFERGIALLRNCEGQLRSAEQKVQILLQQQGTTGSEGEVLADFHDEGPV